MNYLKPDAEQSTEIVIPGVSGGGQTGQRWYFPNIQNLLPNMAFIMGLETFFVDSVTKGPVSGTTTAPASVMQGASLWLYGSVPDLSTMDFVKRSFGNLLVNGNFLLQGVPLPKLNNLQVLASAATSPFIWEPYRFPYWLVDWTKSYVQLSAAPANTTDIQIPFNIKYCFRAGYLAQS